MVPTYWIKFLDKNGMRDVQCDIPEEADQSEYDGFCLEVFDEKNIIEEMTKCYSGIEAEVDGFVPVACSSRDFDGLYFIKPTSALSRLLG